MTKITIAPNASGTGVMTLAAPNTNTDRIITLPDVTTTLVGTDASQTLTNKTLSNAIISDQLVGLASNAGAVGVYGGSNYLNGAGIVLYGSSHATRANEVAFTNGAYVERMRIDASGNVGIGTSAPVAKLDIVTGTYRAYFDDPGGTSVRLNGVLANNTAYGPLTINGSILAMQTGGLERMQIDGSGNVSIATTAVGGSAKLTVNGTIAAVSGYLCHAGASAGFSFANTFNFFWSGSSLQAWIDSTNIGNVTVTSDYRIKRNIETQTAEALSRVMQLRPVTYQMADYGTMFKASDDIKEGFIAHELAQVIPSAVDGEKDAPDQIQSLRIDALVAVLTKAVQEQQQMIQALQADIAALKGV